MPFETVTGWTGPLDFQLTAADVPVPLTGMTVDLILKDRRGVAIAAATSVPDPVTGRVRYSPTPTDLDYRRSPYTAHWKVTDASGKVVFFPGDEPDLWIVYGQ